MFHLSTRPKQALLFIVLLMCFFSRPCAAADRFEKTYQEAIKNITQKNFNEANRQINTIIRRAPNNYLGYHGRAMIALSQEGARASLKDFNRALELCTNAKNRAHVYVGRGMAYSSLKQTDLAIADYKNAIELDPGSSHPYFSLGFVYERADQYDRAIELYSQAIARKVEPVKRFYALRARVYSRQKESKKALSDTQKALALKPTDDYSHYTQAKIFINLKDYPNAIKELQLLEKQKSHWAPHVISALFFY